MTTKQRIESFLAELELEMDCAEENPGIISGLDIIVPTDTMYCVRMNWIKEFFPELEEAWDKFMDRQTYCAAGFYYHDVAKFLRSKLR